MIFIQIEKTFLIFSGEIVGQFFIHLDRRLIAINSMRKMKKNLFLPHCFRFLKLWPLQSDEVDLNSELIFLNHGRNEVENRLLMRKMYF